MAPGGKLVVVDYLPHGDESMRQDQADVWLGFSPSDIERWMGEAKLKVIAAKSVPSSFSRGGPDAHLAWQVVIAQREKSADKSH